MGALAWAYCQSYKIVPDDRALGRLTPAVATEIVSSDGVLLARLGPENRRPVPLERVPRHLCNAVIAVEDRRFWERHGLDGRGYPARACSSPRCRRSHARRRQYVDATARAPALPQSAKDAGSKADGGGPGAADRAATDEMADPGSLPEPGVLWQGRVQRPERCALYFGKDVAELDLAECALLAGLLRPPSRGRPLPRPTSALASVGTSCSIGWRRRAFLSVPWKEARRAGASPFACRPPLHPLCLGYFRAPSFCGARRLRLRTRPTEALLSAWGFPRHHLARLALCRGLRRAAIRTGTAPRAGCWRRTMRPSSASILTRGSSGRWSAAPTSPARSGTAPPRLGDSQDRPSNRSSIWRPSTGDTSSCRRHFPTPGAHVLQSERL